MVGATRSRAGVTGDATAGGVGLDGAAGEAELVGVGGGAAFAEVGAGAAATGGGVVGTAFSGVGTTGAGATASGIGAAVSGAGAAMTAGGPTGLLTDGGFLDGVIFLCFSAAGARTVVGAAIASWRGAAVTASDLVDCVGSDLRGNAVLVELATPSGPGASPALGVDTSPSAPAPGDVLVLEGSRELDDPPAAAGTPASDAMSGIPSFAADCWLSDETGRPSEVVSEPSDAPSCSVGGNFASISLAVVGAISVPSVAARLDSVSPLSMLANARDPLFAGFDTAATPATRALTANSEHAAYRTRA